MYLKKLFPQNCTNWEFSISWRHFLCNNFFRCFLYKEKFIILKSTKKCEFLVPIMTGISLGKNWAVPQACLQRIFSLAVCREQEKIPEGFENFGTTCWCVAAVV